MGVFLKKNVFLKKKRIFVVGRAYHAILRRLEILEVNFQRFLLVIFAKKISYFYLDTRYTAQETKWNKRQTYKIIKILKVWLLVLLDYIDAHTSGIRLRQREVREEPDTKKNKLPPGPRINWGTSVTARSDGKPPDDGHDLFSNAIGKRHRNKSNALCGE